MLTPIEYLVSSAPDAIVVDSGSAASRPISWTRASDRDSLVANAREPATVRVALVVVLEEVIGDGVRRQEDEAAEDARNAPQVRPRLDWSSSGARTRRQDIFAELDKAEVLIWRIGD